MADGSKAPDNAASKDAHECVEFVRLSAEADSTNRSKFREMLRFSYGNQWPAESAQSRLLQERPALTINETDAYCRRITNAMREQRPRIKVHPVDSGADVKTAKVIAGLCRHVEVNSGAGMAYDYAGEMGVRGGWGYWRLLTDYVREDSFNQDIYIHPIYDTLSVYFDPNSMRQDGSDAEKVALTDRMSKTFFKQEYPGARCESFTQTGGDTQPLPEWEDRENITLAEFYRVERKKARLVRLSDGKTTMDLYEDEMPSAAMMAAQGVRVVGSRDSYKRVIKWQKQSAYEILEERVIPGRWIPVIPCYGVRALIDGKIRKMGAVEFAVDPQIMINFWTTAITECVAQSPKAKWLMAAGQGDGWENQFARANLDAKAVLYYNQVDVDGKPAPPPQRVQPEGPPQGAITALMGAKQNLMSVMGIFDPESRSPAFAKSGVAYKREDRQTEQSNYHFYDNLTASIEHTGRVILGWTPTVWDTANRIQRVIGEDGKPEVVTLNEQREPKEPGGVETVLNDVTVGNYDVVMETGPGYNTRREEGVAAMMELMATPIGEKVAQVADDVIVGMMDFPGSDLIAERLRAANPLAQLDETSDVPPEAQMKIKALEVQLKQAGEMIQGLELEKKFGLEKEQMRQQGETRRTLMKETSAQATEHIRQDGMLAVENAENDAWMRDTAVRAQAQLSVAELNAFVKLLTTHQQGEISDRAAERQIAAKADAARAEAST